MAKKEYKSKYDNPAKEFDRGYNFGKQDGNDELLKRIVNQGGKLGVDVMKDEVLIRIPREYFVKLEADVQRTL